MFQKITFYRSLLVVIISILLVVLIVYAFSEPTQAPPGGNVPAPLNVGPSGQSKAGGLILNTGGAATGLIVDKGNVGIGTTVPGAKLGIYATESGPGGWLKGIHFERPEHSAITITHPTAGGLLFGMHGINNAFYFGRYNPNGTWDKYLMYIGGNGNVGIGTTNPQVRLDVQGGWVRIGDPASNAIQFETQSGFHRVAFKDLRFWDWDTGGDMVTFNNGNVGIGTTNPTQKLDVAGYVKGRSGLCIGDDCRTSWPAGATAGTALYKVHTYCENPDSPSFSATCMTRVCWTWEGREGVLHYFYYRCDGSCPYFDYWGGTYPATCSNTLMGRLLAP